jgi:hypothetical protein
MLRSFKIKLGPSGAWGNRTSELKSSEPANSRANLARCLLQDCVLNSRKRFSPEFLTAPFLLSLDSRSGLQPQSESQSSRRGEEVKRIRLQRGDALITTQPLLTHQFKSAAIKLVFARLMPKIQVWRKNVFSRSRTAQNPHWERGFINLWQSSSSVNLCGNHVHGS